MVWWHIEASSDGRMPWSCRSAPNFYCNRCVLGQRRVSCFAHVWPTASDIESPINWWFWIFRCGIHWWNSMHIWNIFFRITGSEIIHLFLVSSRYRAMLYTLCLMCFFLSFLHYFFFISSFETQATTSWTLRISGSQWLWIGSSAHRL